MNSTTINAFCPQVLKNTMLAISWRTEQDISIKKETTAGLKFNWICSFIIFKGDDSYVLSKVESKKYIVFPETMVIHTQDRIVGLNVT